MRRTLFGLSVLSVLALAAGAGAQVPPEFTEVGPDAAEIDFESVVVAINCGDATYQVRGETFWAYRSPELDPYCNRSFNNLTGPSWNGAWPNPFDPGDPELAQLDEVYKSISYWDQPMWLEFKGLVTGELYKIQFLFTANAQNTWDHGGSVRVFGAEETDVFSDVHLNTFARGLPFVVTAEDIEPSADGIIRVEYFHDVDWVPSPALDNNKIWSGIILNGAMPVAFPTDLAIKSDGQKVTLSWVNHEPSTSGQPYDQIEIIGDDKVRGILAQGAAVIDEARDTSFVIDLTLPANADLRTGGMHRIGLRTTVGTSSSETLRNLAVPPIGIAVGDYGAGFTQLETSDGRVWMSDAGIVQSDSLANWMGNVPFDGIPNLEEFGLDPLDPADQSLFAIFRYDAGGGYENHMTIRLAIADGKYDIRLYFWEFDSPWIRDRTGQVSVEGGPKTSFGYADDMDEFAPLPNQAWSILLESAEVKDGELNIDLFNGWGANRDVTLAAFEVLPADPNPKGPRNFLARRTNPRIYELTWELPAGADHDMINVLSRISGQNESLDGALKSFTFEQEITFETTDNEGFALQARKGNTFYAQVHAGAGAAPMFINAGGAGNVNGGEYVDTPIDARGEVWVSDRPYVDRRHDFVPPLVSGDLHYVRWGSAFQVVPGSAAEDLNPPFDTAPNLQGGEVQLLQQIRWCEGYPANDVAQLMTWQIPISPADPKALYLVRLYFGEGCCTRADDVVVEGSEPQRIYYNGLAGGDSFPTDRDYVVTSMGAVGIMEFDGVQVNDGFLTIDFNPFCPQGSPYDSNATISAIEILLPRNGCDKFPTDLSVRGEAQKVMVSWVNHLPYDQIEILADGKVRGILGRGGAVIDVAKDINFSIDLSLPANADLRGEGIHRIGIRTTCGQDTRETLRNLAAAPIRFAVGDYGAGFTGLETSDGRLWLPDAGVVQASQLADWRGNVPFDGIPNLEEFGLDPMDPTDQSLFAIFRWDDAGGLENHMTIRLAIADGKYDIRLYFWEYDSPWLRVRNGQVSVEGGPRTFISYGDDLGEFAPLATGSEAWSILFESAEVKDGELSIDFLNGWGGDRNPTLAAFEILPAAPNPKGPKNFRATRTGAGMYDLKWDLPAGADHDMINIMSRISGQNESLDGAATSFLFEQEIAFETTDNEGFVLQARKGNTFYAQLHAGAGAAPMFINAGGAGDVNGNVYVETPVDARGEVWVSDLPYVDRRRDFVAPLVSGDLNYVQWGNAFIVVPGTSAEDLDPPFDNPDNLQAGELQLLQQIRWCEGPPANDVMQLMTWQVPIDKGNYLVRLYLGEGCCVRSVDAVVEGSDPQRIYYNGLAAGDTYPDDRDYVETVMGGVGVMEFDGVRVDDGFVTIDFVPFANFGQPYDNNATISAIEILPTGIPPREGFIRGDADGNGQYTLGDGIQILSLQFDPAFKKLGSDCDDTGDLDDNGVFTIGDAIYLFNFLFVGGPPPVGQPLTPGRVPESCMKDTTPSASMRPCNYPSAASCP